MFDDHGEHRWGDIFKMFDNGSMLLVDENPWWKYYLQPNLQFTDMNFAHYYRRFYKTKKIFI